MSQFDPKNLKPVEPWWEANQKLAAAHDALVRKQCEAHDALIEAWVKALMDKVKDAPDRYELHVRRFHDETVYSFERRPEAGHVK